MRETTARVKRNNSFLHVLLIACMLLFYSKGSANTAMKSIEIEEDLVINLQNQVQGVVLDVNNTPLPGATVHLKGTKNGVVTDFDGNFSINVPNGSGTLVVSYISYITKEVSVSGTQKVTIVLEEDLNELDEVVVIGYGSVKKSDLTGSVSTVKAEDITNASTVSVDQALAGRASGVLVTQSSGVPGAGANVRIRGISSLRGSAPLYVIDGVPMDNTALGALDSDTEQGGQISPLSTINPSDIASMEVLKDASATAVYGSRGANGVIIITTKRGKTGQGVVEFETEYGVSNLPRKIDLMNANEYWINRYTAKRNSNSVTEDEELNYQIALQGEHETYDWQDYVFQQGQTINNNLKISGGKENLRYLFSLNYYDVDGIVRETDFDRISARLNLDAKVSKSLEFGARLSFSRLESNQQSTNTNFNTVNGTNSVIMRALRTAPTVGEDAALDVDGVESYTPQTAIEGNNYFNKVSEFNGNVFGKFNFNDNISFKTVLSYQGRNADQDFYQKDIFPPNISRGGVARSMRSSLDFLTNTNTLNFDYNFGDNFQFSALLGQSYEYRENNSLRISNAGFSNDILTFYAPHTAAFNDPDQVGYTDSKLLSFFGRVNLNYKSKILLTLTGRYDGSSKFAANNKYGFFPAAALAYKLDQEDFLKDSEVVSTMKLRLSYGESGNQAIQPYQSLNQLSADQYPFNLGGTETLSPVFYVSQLPNNDLQWERTSQLNVGLDFGFWNSRLTGTFDYYNKVTDNLLVVGNKIPAHSGFTVYTENFGKLKTNGIEVALNASLIRTDNVSWDIGVNYSTGKTKIDDLNQDYIESGYNQGWISGGSQRLIIGEELGAFYGYSRAGISQFSDFEEFQGLSTEEQITLYNSDLNATYTPITDADGNGAIAARPGEQMYEDLNGDGIINELDQDVIGRAQADGMVGFKTSFRFKQFDISAYFDAQFGGEIANVTNFQLLSFDDGQQLQRVTEAWTPENPSSIYPRPDSSNRGAQSFRFSDRYIEDASFFRFQNITVGYNLSRNITDKLGISGMRFYASGNNLFIVSDYTGYTPDVSLTGSSTQTIGHDNAGYPVPRTFMFGVNVKF
ncbi:SusC/RagA family TonB-linked outer membrane protein [Joostella sp.]|uniref:SusC/RagA family TonB-linked outer membrane protein n=1 Tax=Joostella sp. TaxID=2231138 RepID=UPI003A8FAA87